MTLLRDLGRRAFTEGLNVSAALRDHLGGNRNTPEAIEIAYDLQAGSYVAFANEHPKFIYAYARQLAVLLEPHLQPGDCLLDAGTGEMTTLSHMLAALPVLPSKVYATDISERRLEIGREYARTQGLDIEAFRAELGAIPLPDKSVDVITTNHALEPNGGREAEIIKELLRIAKRKLVLFEPCYELASDDGKARMRGHGYVRDLSRHAQELGAVVESLTPLVMVHNPLNPTACLIVRKL